MDDLSFEQQMVKLREKFLTRLTATRGDLQELLAARDAEGIRSISHRLKGSAASYGFKELGETAAAVESSLKSESGESLADCAQPLVDAVDVALGERRPT